MNTESVRFQFRLTDVFLVMAVLAVLIALYCTPFRSNPVFRVRCLVASPNGQYLAACVRQLEVANDLGFYEFLPRTTNAKTSKQITLLFRADFAARSLTMVRTDSEACNRQPLNLALRKSLAFTPCSNLLVQGRLDGTVRILEVQTARLVRSIDTGFSSEVCVSTSSHSRTLAIGGRSPCLLADVTSTDVIPMSWSNANSVAVSCDGQSCAFSSIDGHVNLVNVNDHRVVSRFDVHDSEIRAIAFALNDKVLICGAGKQLWAFDLVSGAGSHIAQTGTVMQLSVAHDGVSVAVALSDKSLLFDVAPTCLTMRKTFPHVENAVPLGPDMKFIAGTNSEGELVVIDADTEDIVVRRPIAASHDWSYARAVVIVAAIAVGFLCVRRFQRNHRKW